MYKILALPIIDVNAKITKSYFIYKLGLTMVSLLYICLYIAYIVRFNPWTEVSTQYY